MPGAGFDPFEKFGIRNIGFRFIARIPCIKLGLKRENSLDLCFKGLADIKDNIGNKGPVLHIVKNMRGAPALLGNPLLVSRFYFGQPAVKEGVKSQNGSLSVVGMPIRGRPDQAEMRSIPSNLFNNLQLVFTAVPDVRIRKPKVFAYL